MPVPPFAMVSAVARVSEPSAANDELAVAPNFAVSAENSVEEAC